MTKQIEWFDHTHTAKIVCPHCGAEDDGPGTLDMSGEERECETCGKAYRVWPTVIYTTEKID